MNKNKITARTAYEIADKALMAKAKDMVDRRALPSELRAAALRFASAVMRAKGSDGVAKDLERSATALERGVV